eukprot:CAMPEP_0179034946 /NCGR_PEP_ID=MMETSP0796-20121207/12864_1 /TAXON_ID=73915 /ORGANISM="Pyrodinium bahamense, Strain pbaha01" /LENGTH=240 /DNA_ID=CAMNT_0020731217 /DNA_START=65 /DNA_END=788 /DNA_ORIENTATION=+
MFSLSTCNACGCGGNRQTDTVKVSFGQPADACDKENEAPCVVKDKEAERQDAATEEQRCWEQEEEDEDRRRAREEEEAEADRQRLLELERQQELERQRMEELERQRRLQEEQRAREEQQLRQQEEEARRRAEEARKQEEEEAQRRAEEAQKQEQLSNFLSKHGFKDTNEKKKIKSGMFSSVSAYPLHVAVRAADAQAVGLLLWGGADKTLQDSAKRTPLALAEKLNKNGSHEHVMGALAG